jgi:hypothetical protein
MPDVTSPFAFPYPEETDLVRDGAQDIENLATGVNDYLAGGYIYAGQRRYTSSGTFAKADAFGDTSNVVPRAIRVRVQGGGASGGSAATAGASETAAAGGGGAGSYAESFITNIAGLDATETVTVGTGGSPGAAGNNAGNAGGQSSFGTLVVAPGGGAGGGGASTSGFATGTGGTSGAAATGDIAIRGGRGGLGVAQGGTSVSGGQGGNSMLGFGGIMFSTVGTTTLSNAGQEAAGFGSGSGGSLTARGGAAIAAAAGQPGLIIVDIYL